MKKLNRSKVSFYIQNRFSVAEYMNDCVSVTRLRGNCCKSMGTGDRERFYKKGCLNNRPEQGTSFGHSLGINRRKL